VDELYTVALAEGLASPVSVLSGPADPSVIDPDVYRRLAADLGSNGCQIVADLSGEHLTAVLRGGVAFVKVSEEELLSDRRAEDASTEALVAAAHQLRKEGAGSVLISRSDQPAIALFGDQVTSVHGPPMQTADHRGAGDSMSGAVAAVLARDGSAEDAVRTGAAAGALNVTRSGLGTGRAEAVRELVRRVRLEPIDGGG
jgi:1-phosphofructokinase